MSTQAPQAPRSDHALDWKTWHEHRIASVSAPYGPLALTGTHWLADGVPEELGRWREGGDEVVLSADEGRQLRLDGALLTGEVRLGADVGPAAESRLAQGDRRLVVLRREGLWAVRVWDPESPARQAFAGIDATPYEERFRLPGTFRPYQGRQVKVANADGVERGLELAGEIAFTLGGQEHTLQVSVEADGSLWAVFADGTSGKSTFRFRFLRPEAPGEDGTVTVDFNRAQLPPCAFADHFICPFPPPGNTLPIDIPAGERNIRTS
ncbi:DUF1684 domain-containing protein [Streptomyces sp. WM6378]|uniref:DUF1684 domain-containing protein n=1 Tax=Streptomyces sp. WM6378 TaxID=1415557 RepID=UPI0006AF0FA1|nr:DUF1684 domain-containing protein [Streptomyces sp. WM6378]KOU54572.1 hypothetical protein ADK54_00290 [Streptomyces sp. WM6378]